jgi:hypothetical protein
MEMKSNEAGSNPGICLQSLNKDSSNDGAHIRACSIVECGSQLSIGIGKWSSKPDYKKKRCN